MSEARRLRHLLAMSVGETLPLEAPLLHMDDAARVRHLLSVGSGLGLGCACLALARLLVFIGGYSSWT